MNTTTKTRELYVDALGTTAGLWTLTVWEYVNGSFEKADSWKILAMPEEGQTVAECLAWSIVGRVERFAGEETVKNGLAVSNAEDDWPLAKALKEIIAVNY